MGLPDLEYTKEFKLAAKHQELDECEMNIRNIGWSLGNACPYKCKQCYSLSVREKGANINSEIVDAVIGQIKKLDVKTVNLGGNEPWFTNGLHGRSMLPYIIKKLKEINVDVGITTSGITLIKLKNKFPEILEMLNDVDISLDSPVAHEHNENRGANLFKLAITALEICEEYNIDRGIIICAMKWNFTRDRIDCLLKLAKRYNANIRFNMLKPVTIEHLDELVGLDQFYENYNYLLNKCDTIDITEPRLAAAVNNKDSLRCPCGRTSLRIHSITPEGKIPVSPCVYLHDYKVGNLLENDIIEIIYSEPFKEFRRRNKNPHMIEDCKDCDLLNICGGGCTAKAYLWNYWKRGGYDIYCKEPNCFKEYLGKLDLSSFKMNEKQPSLVHMDYLCTWIGKPR